MSLSDRVLTVWRLWRAGRLLRASRIAWDAGRHRHAIVLLERAGPLLAANRKVLG